MSAMITPEYLLSNAKKYANEPALSSKDAAGNWDTTTWAEFSNYTMDVAKAETTSVSTHTTGKNGTQPTALLTWQEGLR